MAKRTTKPGPENSRYSLWIYTGKEKEVYYSFPHLDKKGQNYQVASMERRLLTGKKFVVAYINDEFEKRTIKTIQGYRSGIYRLAIWQPESHAVDRIYSNAEFDSNGAEWQFYYLVKNYLQPRYKKGDIYTNSTAIFELAREREQIIKMYSSKIVSINPKYIRDEIKID